MNDEKFIEIIADIKDEFVGATRKFEHFHSEHEGLAVIREEYLELEKEVFKNQRDYNYVKMKKEAIQLATMAIRFVYNCIDM